MLRVFKSLCYFFSGAIYLVDDFTPIPPIERFTGGVHIVCIISLSYKLKFFDVIRNRDTLTHKHKILHISKYLDIKNIKKSIYKMKKREYNK